MTDTDTTTTGKTLITITMEETISYSWTYDVDVLAERFACEPTVEAVQAFIDDVDDTDDDLLEVVRDELEDEGYDHSDGRTWGHLPPSKTCRLCLAGTPNHQHGWAHETESSA